MLFFIASASWRDIELTLSKKGKLFYKYLIIDDNEGSGSAKRSKRRPLREREMDDQYLSQTPRLVAGSLNEGLVDDESRANRSRGDGKRPKIDVFFQFICLSVGMYFAMLFTNWTSTWGYTFTGYDIVDYSTIWIRFSGIVVGILYVIAMGIRNIATSKNY